MTPSLDYNLTGTWEVDDECVGCRSVVDELLEGHGLKDLANWNSVIISDLLNLILDNMLGQPQANFKALLQNSCRGRIKNSLFQLFIIKIRNSLKRRLQSVGGV